MSDPHIPFSRPQMLSQMEIDAIAKSFDRIYPSRVNVPVHLNGSTKFINMMLSVLALLITAAICGEVAVYAQVQVLQATVNMIVSGHVK